MDLFYILDANKSFAVKTSKQIITLKCLNDLYVTCYKQFLVFRFFVIQDFKYYFIIVCVTASPNYYNSKLFFARKTLLHYLILTSHTPSKRVGTCIYLRGVCANCMYLTVPSPQTVHNGHVMRRTLKKKKSLCSGVPIKLISGELHVNGRINKTCFFCMFLILLCILVIIIIIGHFGFLLECPRSATVDHTNR